MSSILLSIWVRAKEPADLNPAVINSPDAGAVKQSVRGYESINRLVGGSFSS
jgi:hypothetical protein